MIQARLRRPPVLIGRIAIRMLGILSEVLPSIGSVARLSISNRPKGTPHAFVMRLEGTVFDAQGRRFEIVGWPAHRQAAGLPLPVLHRQKTAAG